MRSATTLLLAAAVIGAQLVNAKTGKLTLCNEPQPSDDGYTLDCPTVYNPDAGPEDLCTHVDLTFDAPKTGDAKKVRTPCLAVPDYNAKGDIGSCGAYTGDAFKNLGCTFFEDGACQSKNKLKINAMGGAGSYSLIASRGQPDSIVYRSFYCQECTGDNAQC